MDPRDVKKEPRLNFTRRPPSAQASQTLTQPQPQRQKKNTVKRAQRAAVKTDKADHKAEKAAAKADKAELKLPQKAVRKKYYNEATGKLEKGLRHQTTKPPKQSDGFLDKRAQRAAVKTDKAVRKAKKAAAKADKAELKLPQKAVRKRYYNEATGKLEKGLQHQTTKPLKRSGVALSPAAAAARAGLHKVESKLSEGSGSDPNEMSEGSTRLAKQTASGALFVAESVGFGVRKLDQSRRLHPYQKAAKAEKKLAQKNVKALRAQEAEAHPTSNPLSKQAQRKKIKESYAQLYRQDLWGRNAPLTQPLSWKDTGVGLRTFAVRKRQELAASVKRYGLMLGGIGMIVVFLLSSVSSCGVMLAGIGGSSTMSAYPAEEADILQAEAYYCQLEATLQEQLDHYEENHEYDEYHYELDEIHHDPYVLMSIISAKWDEDEAWTFDDVKDDLDELFEGQYRLTEEIAEEERERPVEEDPENPGESEEPEDPEDPNHLEYDDSDGEEGDEDEEGNSEGAEDEEPETETYTAYICTVRLRNADLSHLPVYLLSERNLERYSVYMKTLGWRPDLFPDSPYVSLYGGEHEFYAIPTEALEDKLFAAMMKEASKYLGYPYVWGGSTPATSFDCSGFVSWVINHTYVDDDPVWRDIGRRNVDGLFSFCTPTSTPHPGDLVFFRGTYETPGFSHVGFYVGVNPENGHRMMLHCGDPIQFADLNNTYWQQHFAGYGSLPRP